MKASKTKAYTFDDDEDIDESSGSDFDDDEDPDKIEVPGERHSQFEGKSSPLRLILWISFCFPDVL